MPAIRSAVAFAALLALSIAAAGQESQPSKNYDRAQRTSNRWIETPKGSVAVDEGVSWKGVTVYLSLMWDLVAVDEATGKTLWDQSVGAFWNEIGFKEIDVAPGTKTWAVELRPGKGAREGRELRQYHDLRTGKRIGVPEPAPAGKALEVKPQWSGRWSAVADKIRKLVGSQKDFDASVLEPMFAGVKKPPLGEIDFTKSLVLVIASGETWNSNGIEADAWEDDGRILVRLRELTFQSEGPDGGGQRVRPYGIFVLPRRDPFKRVIVERNAQGLIGGPPLWKEVCTFEALGDPVPAPAKQKSGR
jgi:hypothetical protein